MCCACWMIFVRLGQCFSLFLPLSVVWRTPFPCGWPSKRNNYFSWSFLSSFFFSPFFLNMSSLHLIFVAHDLIVSFLMPLCSFYPLILLLIFFSIFYFLAWLCFPPFYSFLVSYCYTLNTYLLGFVFMLLTRINVFIFLWWFFPFFRSFGVLSVRILWLVLAMSKFGSFVGYIDWNLFLMLKKVPHNVKILIWNKVTSFFNQMKLSSFGRTDR